MGVRRTDPSQAHSTPWLGLLIAAAAPVCLLAGAAPWLPPQVRMWSSFVLLLLLPGLPVACLALREQLDIWETVAASFVGSLVILTVGGLLSHILGWRLGGVLWLVPGATILLGVAHWRLSRSCISETVADEGSGGARRGVDSLPPKALHLITLALLCVALLRASTLSGDMAATSDAFDHIATVREVHDSGDLFPLTAWYNYPEAPLPDPRKGLFHVGLAALCSYSGQDPVDVWMWLPRALLPLVLVVVFSLGRTLTGSWAGGWLAALFWLLCFGGPASRLPIQVGYAHNVSEAASWVLIMLLIKYATGGGRGLVLASGVGLVACCFVHISAFVLVLAAWGCLLVACLVLGGARRRLCTKLGAVGLVWLVLGVLAAAAKVLMSYAPANPVQLQTQNLLYWTSSLYTVNPVWVYYWLGLAGVLAVLLALALAFRSEKVPGRLYLVGATLIPIAIVLNPVLVPPLYSIVGYLVERFTWVIPYPHVLAFVAVASYRRVLAPGTARERLGASVLIGVVIVSVWVTASSRNPTRQSDHPLVVAWKPALNYLQSNVDTSSVVASDLLTSYAIPAFTRHHIVSTLHQHGSPNDPKGVDRMVALVEIMDPDAPAEALKRGLLEQEVDFVLVNSTFERKRLLQYAEVDPEVLSRLRRRLQWHPDVFREVFDEEDLSIFAVDREALPDWDAKDVGRRPYLLPPEQVPPGRPMGTIFAGKVELVSVELPQATVPRGGSFRIVCYWQSKIQKLDFDLPWVVQIRIQTDYPKGRLYSPAYSRIYRKGLEFFKGESYRWRAPHLPANGVLPPSCWEDYIVKDTAEVKVPRNLAPGTYDVSAFIGQRPAYPNLALRDLLRDDDQYSGVRVGSLVIE